MHDTTRALFLVAILAAGCDSSDTGGDAGAPRDGAPAADASVPDGAIISVIDGGSSAVAIAHPPAGHTFLESIEVVAVAGGAVSSVSFFVGTETDPRCVDTTAPFRCLLHLDDVAVGAVALIARAGTAESRVDVTRAAYDPEPCAVYAPFGDPAWGQCVRDWATAGDAAGWAGVTYQNRDGAHAYLALDPFPGITGAMSATQGNAGLASDPLLADAAAIVVTNASLAYTDPTGWKSLARQDLAAQAAVFSQWYRSGKMLWYPEHRDVGATDFFPGYSAFYGVWQGSSYDGWFELSQSVLALGALQADTRAALSAAGALIPAVQMAERRSLARSDRAYLGPAAHETSTIDDPMGRDYLDIVHGMPMDWIPPVITMSVAEEVFTATYEPTTMADEQYVTTPDAILRLFTATTADDARIVVDVSGTMDPNDHPLGFHWRVVRGDPASVRIVLLEDDGSRAELRFDRPAEITERIHERDTLSQMTVVAVFAHNGRYFSAPAFVSVSDASDVYRWSTDANE